ncbi:hypothetical protein [Nocardioides sp. ChNu-153]|uniref:hypothetical protein n=1 Tax=Nocardioides sp. ChNu-153 TaxID=2779364 RepID=UPI002659A9DB|nr:hypothetical protein [Nocardioides sp. ChNu-153]
MSDAPAADVPDASGLETVTARIGGVEVRATARARMAPLAQGVLNQVAALGTAPVDGLAAAPGWGPFTLRARDGGFVVVAPAYETDAAQETEDLSHALTIDLEQVRVAGASRARATFARFDQRVIGVRGCLDAPALLLKRDHVTNPTDSGWFVEPFPPTADRSWTPERLAAWPAWEVARRRWDVGRALALPHGYVAVVEAGRVVQVRDASDAVVGEDL